MNTSKSVILVELTVIHIPSGQILGETFANKKHQNKKIMKKTLYLALLFTAAFSFS